MYAVAPIPCNVKTDGVIGPFPSPAPESCQLLPDAASDSLALESGILDDRRAAYIHIVAASGCAL